MSSILRPLSGDDIFVEDRLFATLDTLTREVDVGGGYRFRLADTVGFIRKLPHHLVASFRATLEEARAADLLLHVIDAAHPAWEEQVEVVERELRIADFGLRIDKERPERKRVIYVFNKADLLPDPGGFLAQVRERYPHAVLTSSIPQSAIRNPQLGGVDGLRTVLRDRKSTRLNSSHSQISYAVFCLKKKTITMSEPFTALTSSPPHSTIATSLHGTQQGFPHRPPPSPERLTYRVRSARVSRRVLVPA